jgi:hypothetical protein
MNRLLVILIGILLAVIIVYVPFFSTNIGIFSCMFVGLFYRLFVIDKLWNS